MTIVKEIMKKEPAFIAPDATLQEAARLMRKTDCGILPVGTADHVRGIITDRDIVIRAVGKGKNVEKEQVKDYMTDKVYSFQEDQTLEQAARTMNKNDVSRLLIIDKSEKIVGILSFGTMMRKNINAEEMSRVVECAIHKEAA